MTPHQGKGWHAYRYENERNSHKLVVFCHIFKNLGVSSQVDQDGKGMFCN